MTFSVREQDYHDKERSGEFMEKKPSDLLLEKLGAETIEEAIKNLNDLKDRFDSLRHSFNRKANQHQRFLEAAKKVIVEFRYPYPKYMEPLLEVVVEQEEE